MPWRRIRLVQPTVGNLHPLLNGESLKNWPNGEFENRMSQIWSIFKQMFENRSIFKQMFENTVHFQTHFEIKCLEMDRIIKHLFGNGPIFKHLFENGPYLAHPFFKLAIGPVFQTFTIQ